jgi:transcriptional regulator with XRE-family HTH domain
MGVPTVGDRVWAARKFSGLMQKELADRCDRVLMTVSRWECGRTEPSADDLDAVAEATAVPFLWLSRGRGESPCAELAELRAKKRKAAERARRRAAA